MVVRKKSQKRWLLPALALVIVCLAGCDSFKTDKYRFLSPDKAVRAPKRSPVSPILPSLSAADPGSDLLPNSSFPRAEDWVYTDREYVIGPGDVLDISILDLYSEGMETIIRREVSANGYVDLPQLSARVQAEKLTKEQFRQAVREAYSPTILKDPTISVTVSIPRQNTFSILGAISRPGAYPLLRRDMRILDALAMAGDVTQVNIPYLYVIRQAPPQRKSETQPADPAVSPPVSALPPLPELPEEKTPAAQVVTVPAAPVVAPVPAAAEVYPQDPAPPAAAAARPAAPQIQRWVFRDGKWVEVKPAPPAPPVAAAAQPSAPAEPLVAPRRPVVPLTGDPNDPFGWQAKDGSKPARLIAIDIAKLKAGDPRMNIVLRENDIVQVPMLQVGEFYVMGEVSRPGVYSLTGRHVTVKQALAAAGNLGPLAWPKNSLLIRRIAQHQEQTIPLDLEAIIRGEQPDIFLKPDDVLAVGTDVRAPFLAVLRNAFRMTYGFGFIYDRNFADPLIGSVTGARFTRL